MGSQAGFAVGAVGAGHSGNEPLLLVTGAEEPVQRRQVFGILDTSTRGFQYRRG